MSKLRSMRPYIPPCKRPVQAIRDRQDMEYQKMTWDALRNSINALVNKANMTNIRNIISELFRENLVRGRGLFCRCCMKSQLIAPEFTPVFAAIVAVVNSRFPDIGNLLVRRVILQFQKAYKRNDKPLMMAAAKFMAHLVNQQVVDEILALELLTILLEKPFTDGVEVGVEFVKDCGSILEDVCPKGMRGIFDRFRGILHEGEIDRRVQFMIEGLYAIRKANFRGRSSVEPELDLVNPEDQFTHEISLHDEIDPETSLDIFRYDPDFIEHEKKYEEVKKSMLGDESGDEDDADDDDDDDDIDGKVQLSIKDATDRDLVELRRTIYLTIMSGVRFEEVGHKLLKIKLEAGQEMELCRMILECCSQERTYVKLYGLLGQRLCLINKLHQKNFQTCFLHQYSMVHRLETNKLRNVAYFFAHLLATDALPWHVLAYIKLTEEDTTSSSRIFIKFLFQELAHHLDIPSLILRLNHPSCTHSLLSIFPIDHPRNTRFAINFFTSIGLGGLTDNLREHLKKMQRLIRNHNSDDDDQPRKRRKMS